MVSKGALYLECKKKQQKDSHRHRLLDFICFENTDVTTSLLVSFLSLAKICSLFCFFNVTLPCLQFNLLQISNYYTELDILTVCWETSLLCWVIMTMGGSHKKVEQAQACFLLSSGIDSQ